jgi:hypothetical protein
MQRLKAGGYVSVPVPAGEYNVTARQTLFLIVPTIPKTITVAVAPGSHSYVRVDQRIVDVDRDGGWRAMQEVFIEEVDEETGRAEIASARANL